MSNLTIWQPFKTQAEAINFLVSIILDRAGNDMSVFDEATSALITEHENDLTWAGAAIEKLELNTYSERSSRNYRKLCKLAVSKLDRV